MNRIPQGHELSSAPPGSLHSGPYPSPWPGSCLVSSPVVMPPLFFSGVSLTTFLQVTKCQDYVFPFFEGHVSFLSLNPQVPVPSLFSKTCYNFPQTPECSHFISSNLRGFVSEQWYFIVDWLLINSLEIPMLGPLGPGLPCCGFRSSPGLSSQLSRFWEGLHLCPRVPSPRVLLFFLVCPKCFTFLIG